MIFVRFIRPREFIFPLEDKERRRFKDYVRGVRRVQLSTRERCVVRNGDMCLTVVFVARKQDAFPLVRLRLRFFLREGDCFVGFARNKNDTPREGGVVGLPTREQSGAEVIFVANSGRHVDRPLLNCLVVRGVAKLRDTSFRRCLSHSPMGDPNEDDVVANFLCVRFIGLTVNAVSNCALGLNVNNREIVVMFGCPIDRYPSQDLCFGRFARDGQTLPNELSECRHTVRRYRMVKYFVDLSLHDVFVEFPTLDRHHDQEGGRADWYG